MENTTQCTSMGEYKEVSIQILPIDGLYENQVFVAEAINIADELVKRLKN